MRRITSQIYKIRRYRADDEFIEAKSISEVTRYVAENDKNGHTVISVNEIRADGTHPKVTGLRSLKAYKDVVGSCNIVSPVRRSV